VEKIALLQAASQAALGGFFAMEKQRRRGEEDGVHGFLSLLSWLLPTLNLPFDTTDELPLLLPRILVSQGEVPGNHESTTALYGSSKLILRTAHKMPLIASVFLASCAQGISDHLQRPHPDARSWLGFVP
jgi:hypothetical protein